MTTTKETQMKDALRIWNHAGLRCAIRSSRIGFVNGYVEVPANHVAFNAHYDRVPVMVHGGLTYGDGDGWLGFDTGHAGDIWTTGDLIRAGVDADDALKTAKYRESENVPEKWARYWTVDLVVAEVESLAEQLASIVELAQPDVYQITDDELAVLRAERDALRAEVAQMRGTP